MRCQTCCGTSPTGCWRPRWWASHRELLHCHTLGRALDDCGLPSGAHLHQWMIALVMQRPRACGFSNLLMHMVPATGRIGRSP